jgi:hypothetical protein
MAAIMISDEFIHLSLCLIAGIIAWLISRRWQVFIFALIGGFFVDADHLFDYFLYHKKLVFDFNEVMSGSFFPAAGKCYNLLHGFEYAIILLVFSAVIFWFSRQRDVKDKFLPTVLLVLGLSLFFHLGFDTIHNKTKWQTYFVSYRIAHHFNIKDFDFRK